MTARATLNLIIPVYNEIAVVKNLFERAIRACEKTDLDWRMIVVDDGSSDGTSAWIEDWCVRHGKNSQPTAQNDLRISGNVTLVKLSRNFGQSAAILAGLKASDADCVIVMDGDLQDPPELIIEMVNRWKNGDQVVIAQRISRDETFIRGLGFSMFHFLFQRIADLSVPHQTGNFCLLDRVVTEKIHSLPESNRYFPGLRAFVGFKQSNILFKRPIRVAGQPKQSLTRLFRYAMDAIFGFSNKPQRFISLLGLLVSLAGLLLRSYFCLEALIQNTTSTLTSSKLLTVVVVMLGGAQLLSFGVLGEYIGRIYDEARQRPQYFVSEVISTDSVAGRQPNQKRSDEPVILKISDIA